MKSELYNGLDSSLIREFRYRGVIITENVYTGFDTEYYQISVNKNKLLSVQLAISTKTLLRLPHKIYYK